MSTPLTPSRAGDSETAAADNDEDFWHGILATSDEEGDDGDQPAKRA